MAQDTCQKVVDRIGTFLLNDLYVDGIRYSDRVETKYAFGMSATRGILLLEMVCITVNIDVKYC